MTQQHASTPDIFVHRSSPSRHRVGNRLPPRGELSPAGEREGETIERRKKIVAEKKPRRRSMSNSPTRRRLCVNSQSSPRVSQPPLRMTVRETIGCEGRGNAINRRDWGSRSQTSIGSHSRAVGAPFRNIARTRETLQDVISNSCHEKRDTNASREAPRCADPSEEGLSS